MTMTGESWLIGIAYAAPLVYLAIRMGMVQKSWLKGEEEILDKMTPLLGTDEQSLQYTSTMEVVETLSAKNKKKSNKILRMGIYFILFTVLFFWRPIKVENNPAQTSVVRQSFVNPIYETDKKWKASTERYPSLQQQQEEAAKQWNKERETSKSD